jgi:hypothetical protein
METDRSFRSQGTDGNERSEFKDNKEAHSKLLHQENQKTKKKRVSFSIFKADTIEEMQKLRKEKEEEFLTMLQMKNKSNQNLSVTYEKLDIHDNQEKQSVSNIAISEPNKNDINFTLSHFDNRLSKTIPVMINEIVKVENIFLQNQSDNIKNSNLSKTQQFEVEHVFSSNIQNLTSSLKENQHFTSNLMPEPNLNTLNTNSFTVKSPKENILFSNSNFNTSAVANQPEEKIREEDLMEEIKEHIRKLNQEIYDSVENNEKEEKSHLIDEIIEEDLILISPKNECVVIEQSLNLPLDEKNCEIKEEINQLPDDKLKSEIMIKENEEIIEEKIQSQVEENIPQIEENIFTIENFCEIFLPVIEQKHQKITQMYNYEVLGILKQILKEEKLLSFKISQFINKRIFNKFQNNTKTSARNRKYLAYNNQQAVKYLKYRNYKIKSNIFKHLKFIADKRKDWICNIKNQLKMNYIW